MKHSHLQLSLIGLLFTMSTSLYAQLNGTYTINSIQPPSATNYQSVNSAIGDLMSGTRLDGGPVQGPGVSGPVTLRIVSGSGPYTEQVTIGAIPGISAVNNVRLTGSPTKETITFAATTTADRQVIKLSGAKHITLDSLSLVNNGITYGYGVHITNASDSNFVKNSYIQVDTNTTSSNFAGITISGSTITASGNWGNYNTIENNVVNGGYYGITIRGTSTLNFAQANKFYNNYLYNFYYYGIYSYYHNLGEYKKNTIISRTPGTISAYGIYIYYEDRFDISQNIIRQSGTYGIYGYYANNQGGFPSSRAKIINNMIGGSWKSTGTLYGMYFSTNCRDIDIHHNSVSMDNGGSSRGLYMISGSGNDIQNNIFSVVGSTAGYALYVSSTLYVNNVNYNDYWIPGSSNFIYIGTAYTPGNFIGGGGYNNNSLNVDPLFINYANDLHVLPNQNLYDAGTNLGITIDIDDDARPMLPSTGYDIGADEFSLPINDVGIASVTSPSVPQCALQNVPLIIVLDNQGIDTLFNCIVNYSINGVPQTPYNWADTIVPGGNKPNVNIGTYSFSPGDVFKIWTSQPNGSLDVYNSNDTMQLVIVEGLSGTYTIGPSGDYTSVNNAVTALNTFGVCGPVTFLLDNMMFNEQITLSQVMGMSAINTVTFKGTGNNSGMQYVGTNVNDNYVVLFNNADHYRLDSMIIKNTSLSYGTVLDFQNGSDSSIVSNCLLENDTNTMSTSLYMSVIMSPSGNINNYNTFTKNTIRGGSHGVYWYGTSSVVKGKGNIFTENTLRKQYYRSLLFYYQDDLEISKNDVLHNSSYTGSVYLAYFYWIRENFNVTSNKFVCTQPNSSIYGMYISSCQGLNNKKQLVANNFLALGDTNNISLTYGIYNTSSSFINYYNNNIHSMNNTTSNYALFMSSGGAVEVLNNNVRIPKSGTALYYSGAFVVSISENNNVYTPNGNVGYYNGLFQASLNNWQQNTGFDLNSLNVDPMYASNTDLHTCAMDLAGSGVSIPAITDDIDGQLRNQNNPYIGADLFMDSNADLLGGNQSKCPQDTVQLQVIADPNETISYLWQPGVLTTPTVSASNAGWYYVTVTTGCGTATDSVEITNEPLPVAIFTSTNSFLTAIFSDASSNATTWNWNFGDGNTSTQQNPFHIYNQSGTYTVTLIVCNDCGCDTTTQEVTVIATGISEISLEDAVSIYPNPNSGNFILSINGVENVSISILSVEGKEVYSEKINSKGTFQKSIKLNVSNGIYFLKLTNQNSTTVRKVIIE